MTWILTLTFCIVSMAVLLMMVLAGSKHRQLTGDLNRERACHRAARQLANVNMARLAAVQDWAMEVTGKPVHEVYAAVKPRIYLPQPATLTLSGMLQGSLDALAFDEETDVLHGTVFARPGYTARERINQLEIAVHTLLDKDWKHDAVQVAQETGVSLSTAERVLLVRHSMVMNNAQRQLGHIEDPEDILPSRY